MRQSCGRLLPITTSCQDDVVDDVFVDSDVIIVPEGEFDLDIGVPGAAKHRTAFASVHALELAYWQAGSPLSPYDVQPIFVLGTRLGVYLFSTRGVPAAMEAAALQFFTTLEEPEPIAFRSAPLGSNLLGSVTTVELTSSRVVIRDDSGFWAKRLPVEAIVNMPCGRFWLIRQVKTIPALTGTVGRLLYSKRKLVIEYGDFRRHPNSQGRCEGIVFDH